MHRQFCWLLEALRHWGRWGGVVAPDLNDTAIGKYVFLYIFFLEINSVIKVCSKETGRADTFIINDELLANVSVGIPTV